MWRLTAPLHFLIQTLLWPFYALGVFLLKNLKVYNRQLSRGIKSPFVVMANHENMFDPFLIGVALGFRPKWYPFFFAAKKSLMWTPLVGQIIWLLSAYSVPRGIGLEKSMAKTLALVKAGNNILVFPQGRLKSHLGRPRTARRGIAYLASRFPNLPILPAKVSTAPYRQRRFFRGQLVIAFGQPFSFTQLGLKRPTTRRELSQAANLIMQKIWAIEAPDAE